MKKFFALFLVVALLAMAGSAFAAPGDTVGHDGNGNNSGGGTSGGGTTTTTVITKVEGTTTSATVTKSVLGASILKAATVLTAQDIVGKTVIQVINIFVTTNTDVFTTALKAVWTAVKLEAIQTAATSAVDTPAKRTALFANTGLGSTVDTTPRSNEEDLMEATSSAPESADEATKLAAVSTNLSSTDRAIGTVGAVSPKRSGTFTFPQSFGPKLYKTKLYGDRNQKNTAKVGTAATASADAKGIVFLNSKGESIDAVPDDSNSSDILPGYVNMLVVMEAGNVYEPVIYTTTASMRDNAGLTESEITNERTSFTVQTVTNYKEETYIGETKVEVPAAVTNALAGTAFAAPKNPEYVNTSVTHASNTSYATSKGLVVGAWLPPMNIATAGAYIAQTDNLLTKTPGSGYATSADSFAFYKEIEDTVSVDKAAFKVLNGDGTETTLANATVGKPVYVAFLVNASGEVAASALPLSLQKPALTFEVHAVENGSGGDKTDNTTPTNPAGDGTGPGDSSGGCSTGFTALALAVLGSFIATRKK